MRRKAVRIKDGSCIVVPVTSGGHAIGVMAKRYRSGFLLCFFFLITDEELLALREHMSAAFLKLQAQSADLVCICSDLGLADGTWEIIGAMPNWNKEEWAAPVFGTKAPEGFGRAMLQHYDEEVLEFVTDRNVTVADVIDLPDAALFGSGAVEIELARIRARREGLEEPVNPSLATEADTALRQPDSTPPSDNPQARAGNAASHPRANNLLTEHLKGLLDALDVVAVNHEEVTDTEVRGHIRAAVHNGFIAPKAGFKLPRKFGMFSAAGDRAVRSVLQSFLDSPDVKRAAEELPTPQERLDAFQDITVQSANGNTYDEYFGEAA